MKYLVTEDNAREWYGTREKFTFCIDLLDISAWDDDAEEKVDRLEQAFENFLDLPDEVRLHERKEGKCCINTPAAVSD